MKVPKVPQSELPTPVGEWPPETFHGLAVAWLGEMSTQLRPRSHENYRLAVVRLLEIIPEVRTRWLTRADLVRFRNRRSQKVSAHTVRRDLKAFSSCLNWAEAVGLGIDHPPPSGDCCRRCQRPRIPR